MTDTLSASSTDTSDPAAGLTGVRRGAYSLYKVLIALYTVALVVQTFLAGLGVFGADGNPTDDEASESLDLHRGIGHVLTQPVALLILIACLIARPGRKIVSITVAMFVMGIVQVVLAIAGEDLPFLGGLHALNAIIVLGLAATATARTGIGRR